MHQGGRAFTTYFPTVDDPQLQTSYINGVAHDFNNILTAITGDMDLLLDDDGINSSQLECLESIRLGGERATQLTSQLLTFSRKGKSKVVDLDLNTELESLQGMLGRLVRDDIMLGFEFGPDLCQIRMDQGQFSQVVFNLVVNACDAMQGGGSIELSTRRTIRERDGVFNSWNVLSVRDSGTGMDEATRERVFEPFFTTKPVGKGTGLGLATTYGIVTSSGGTVEVHSELGLGTCFEIWLPFSTATQAIVAPTPVENPSQFRGRVLIVEDDLSVLKITIRIIEDAGMEVLQARDGSEGLRVIESGVDLDLLLTDAVMPNMNGLELIQAARHVRPGLPVIVCSGYAADDLHRDPMGLDVDFLEKPYSAKGLVELLGQHLSQSTQPS